MPSVRMLDITNKLGGDTLTTSVLMAFNYAMKKNKVASGHKVIFLTLGSGITAGGAVYYL